MQIEMVGVVVLWCEVWNLEGVGCCVGGILGC